MIGDRHRRAGAFDLGQDPVQLVLGFGAGDGAVHAVMIGPFWLIALAKIARLAEFRRYGGLIASSRLKMRDCSRSSMLMYSPRDPRWTSPVACSSTRGNASTISTYSAMNS